ALRRRQPPRPTLFPYTTLFRSGHISGVTRAGLFVKLDDTGADGFIPARTVGGNEYFAYREDRHALVGARSGESHRLGDPVTVRRSEEHTSELQSRRDLVCRLLL